MAEQIRVSRRVVAGTGGLAGLLGMIGLAGAGCDSSGQAPSPKTAGSSGADARRTPDPTVAADARLRERAVADEQRLLAAAAAGAGVEPFATIRGLHRAHLRALTGQLPPEPPVAAPPAAAALVTAERALAVARRDDCIAASAAMAPLLASLSASADVAVSLLSPGP